MRITGKSRFRLWLACLPFSAFCACQSPRDTLPDTWANLETQWRATLAQDFHPNNPISLNWEEAVNLMHDNNIKLKRAQLDIQRSQDQLSQIYWNLVPLLNVQLRADTSLRQISSFGWDNISLDINGLINIPGLVSMQSNLYGARLALLRSEIAWFLAQREQTIELYQTFRKYHSLQRRRSFLHFSERQAALWQNVDPFQATRQREELRRQRRQYDQEEEALQQNLHRLVGLSENWWEPEPEGMPTWDYLEAPLPIEDLRTTGFLQSLLLAVELEGAAARVRGVELQYWPDLSISISGPPLYQIRDGKGKFWDARDIHLFASVFWQIDTQGRIRRQLRQMAAESEIQKAELELQTIEQARRLQQAQELYQEQFEELSKLDEELEWLQDLLQAGQGADPVRNLQAIQTLIEERTLLESKLDEFFTLFWFVDERRWSFDERLFEENFTPPEHTTVAQREP